MKIAATHRRDIWRLDGVSLAATAIGAALYTALNLLAADIALAVLPVIRPGIVIPLVFGARFGPVVGFAVGVLGTSISDLLTFGFFWNWAVGNGLIGLVAGLTPLVAARLQRAWAAVAAGAIMGAIAIVLGITFVAATDVWVTNLTGDEVVTTEWIPVVTWDLAWGLPLTVVVLAAWRTAERFLKRRS